MPRWKKDGKTKTTFSFGDLAVFDHEEKKTSNLLVRVPFVLELGSQSEEE